MSKFAFESFHYLSPQSPPEWAEWWKQKVHLGGPALIQGKKKVKNQFISYLKENTKKDISNTNSMSEFMLQIFYKNMIIWITMQAISEGNIVLFSFPNLTKIAPHVKVVPVWTLVCPCWGCHSTFKKLPTVYPLLRNCWIYIWKYFLHIFVSSPKCFNWKHYELWLPKLIM